ncbi:hypothetical protein F4860DRAFT_462630 [Xylaria cubensis]|nr:hypothetical protein F4860DRAFT_462630 [Xylaria cubensis]
MSNVLSSLAQLISSILFGVLRRSGPEVCDMLGNSLQCKPTTDYSKRDLSVCQMVGGSDLAFSAVNSPYRVAHLRGLGVFIISYS